MLHQVVATKQPGKGRHIGFHQPVAEGAAAVHLLQIGFAHHPPAVGRAWQLEGDALAHHRHTAVVGITGIGHEQVGTAADRLAHAWVQFAGRRVGKAQFQLGMTLHLHGGPRRVHAALEVLAPGERGILETRA
ncbi:hypothetical protein D3C81_320090 [compost metagenome]